jgi:hypothetical protein
MTRFVSPARIAVMTMNSPLQTHRKGRRVRRDANEKGLEQVKTSADSARLPFGLRAQLASAAAWSPNPQNPPLYLDLPFKDG